MITDTVPYALHRGKNDEHWIYKIHSPSRPNDVVYIDRVVLAYELSVLMGQPFTTMRMKPDELRARVPEAMARAKADNPMFSRHYLDNGGPSQAWLDTIALTKEIERRQAIE